MALGAIGSGGLVPSLEDELASSRDLVVGSAKSGGINPSYTRNELCAQASKLGAGRMLVI